MCNFPMKKMNMTQNISYISKFAFSKNDIYIPDLQ